MQLHPDHKVDAEGEWCPLLEEILSKEIEVEWVVLRIEQVTTPEGYVHRSQLHSGASTKEGVEVLAYRILRIAIDRTDAAVLSRCVYCSEDLVIESLVVAK